jgi:hypothetical protein
VLAPLTSGAAPTTKSLSTGSIVVVDASADAEKPITLVHCQNVSFLMDNFVLQVVRAPKLLVLYTAGPNAT